MPTVVHPRIRPGVLDDRSYQAAIAEAALRARTLVVLPTGLGKTAIAQRVIAACLEERPTGSILFLAPTRPLVVQHARSLEATLLAPAPVVLTGTVPPSQRASGDSRPRIVVATPQVIEHDRESGRLSLDEFSLVVFDEAHRAVGAYPYVALARAALATGTTRVLAMTASPGSAMLRIRSVWANLGIQHFEYRTTEDPDVRPYLYGVDAQTVEVPVPVELRVIATKLKTALATQTELLVRLGHVEAASAGRRGLLAVGERLHQEIAALRRVGASPDARVWAATTAQAVAMKLLHAIELAESQGVEALRQFLQRQAAPGRSGRRTPSQSTFLADPFVEEALRILSKVELEHPKVPATVELVRNALKGSPRAKVLIFTQYRATADVVLGALTPFGTEGVRAERFVGQRLGDLGLSQKEQLGLLDRFRSGEINVLVATSVAEEGLDIPSTDLVIFYEPVPDVIRTVQRRGRTGRNSAGRVVVLVAQETRDVGMERSSARKERRMHEMLERLEAESRTGPVAPPPVRTQQRSLSEYPTVDPP